MAVSLKKGEKVELRKSNGATLHHVVVGLGWDAKLPPQKGGILGFFQSQPKIDCDASVVMFQNGKFVSQGDIIYYHNLQHSSQAVRHTGDNRSGKGDGDDEQIIVNLDKLPPEYDQLFFVANIYEATRRNQHFGMIQNAFIRIVDQDTNTEIYRFDLADSYDGMKSMKFGILYKQDNNWKFHALGEGTTDDSLQNLIKSI